MDKGKIILLSLAHMCSDINGGAIPALLPFLVVAFGYSYTDAAVIMFGYACVASLVQPFFGWLSDKWSCFWFIPAAILTMGCAMGAMGFVSSYWGIWICACLCGMGSSLFHPEAARYTNYLSGHSKGAGMSLFSIGGNTGFILGPIIIGFLTPLFGLKSTLFFTVLGVCTAFSFLYSFAHMPPVTKKKLAVKRAQGKNDWHAFAWLTGVVVSRAVVFQGFYSFTAFYWMKYYGASASTGSYMLALFAVVGVISNMTGGILSDRVGYVRILRITQLCLFPAVALFVAAGNPWLSAALLIPVSFCIYASYSPMVILGQTYLARNLGFSAGITLGVSRSAGGIALPLVGLIADHWGLNAALLCLLVPVAVGIVSACMLPQKEPQE